jgi:hypothetical protein
VGWRGENFSKPTKWVFTILAQIVESLFWVESLF